MYVKVFSAPDPNRDQPCVRDRKVLEILEVANSCSSKLDLMKATLRHMTFQLEQANTMLHSLNNEIGDIVLSMKHILPRMVGPDHARALVERHFREPAAAELAHNWLRLWSNG